MTDTTTTTTTRPAIDLKDIIRFDRGALLSEDASGHLSYLGSYEDIDDATHVIIPGTEWADGGGARFGTTLERANWTAMKADFATEVEVIDHFDAHYLAVPLDSMISDALYGAIESLQDYPLYSDDALAEVESELLDEAWDGYYRDEVKSHVAEALDIDLDSAEGDALIDSLQEPFTIAAHKTGLSSFSADAVELNDDDAVHAEMVKHVRLRFANGQLTLWASGTNKAGYSPNPDSVTRTLNYDDAKRHLIDLVTDHDVTEDECVCDDDDESCSPHSTLAEVEAIAAEIGTLPDGVEFQTSIRDDSDVTPTLYWIAKTTIL